MLNFVPNKFVLVSVVLHGALFGGILFEYNKRHSVSNFEEESSGTVEMLFETQTEAVKKELKKVIKKKVKVLDLGDKLADKKEEEEHVHTISLADLKAVNNLSPELKAFLKSLREEILKRQHYPYSAKRLRQTGKVSVQFDVFDDGTVKNVSIYKKSAYDKLNKSAVKIIDDISKVDNFPKETVKSKKISITVPIEYSL